jgi:LmbE family N-acetylglucosaminyl deacetylase
MRLLVITAHPDDESAAFGGTIALYAQRGVEVGVVCATRGEAGRHRGPARSAQELAELRAEEFGAACRLLGAAWCDLLQYPDGGLKRVPLADLGVRLCAVIRARQPQVVATFGLEGSFSGHPDHSAVSHHATFGFHAAGRDGRFPEAGTPWGPAKLYHLTGPQPLDGYAQVCFAPVTAKIDVSTTFALKFEAFQRHTTQAPLLARLRAATERLGQSEYFHLAASRVRVPPGVETDLLSGI